MLLFEGDTEGEFYRRIIAEKVPERKIRIAFDNLKGISTNINNKVIAKITKHIANNPLENQVHVFLGIDREGGRECESPMDIEYIQAKLGQDLSRIYSINEIIATQDIESWFFIDIDNIFRFLRVPKSKRNPSRYTNHEGLNNRDLSKLFRQHKKVYSKGNKVEGLLDSLDLNKIYNGSQDLTDGIQRMVDLV
ncbi:MAG: DUF4276 family protein [Bacteroidota bacterium]